MEWSRADMQMIMAQTFTTTHKETPIIETQQGILLSMRLGQTQKANNNSGFTTKKNRNGISTTLRELCGNFMLKMGIFSLNTIMEIPNYMIMRVIYGHSALMILEQFIWENGHENDICKHNT